MPTPATTGQLRTTIRDMQIGDYIVCNYRASSGAVGAFSNLGGAAGTEIPVEGSSIPNGSFYFVKVDKGLLIADRVIQRNISWDTLNAGKTIQGKPLNNYFGLLNPDVLPSSHGQGVDFSPDGNYLAVAHNNPPYITIYKRNGDTFIKLPNPNVLPAGEGIGVAFSPDGNYLAVAHSNSPVITIYKRNGDSFTKLPNTDVLPTGTGYDVAFSSDGNYLAVALNVNPYIAIFNRNGDSFTKLPNPNALPPNTGNGVSFSPDGNYLAVAHNSSPYITIYKRNGDSFTKLPNPDVLPSSTSGRSVAFSPDGNYLAVAHATSPFITIYKRNGDSFTKLPNPDVIPPHIGYSVAFSPDGNYLAVAHTNSPVITIYKRDGDSFTKLLNPDVLPSSTSGRSVAFSPDGSYLAVAHSGSPFIIIYKNVGAEVTVRSLTGGVAYADANGNKSLTNQGFGEWPTNNEFYRYIVNFPQELIQEGKTVDDVFHVDSGLNPNIPSTWATDTPINGVVGSSGNIANNTHRISLHYNNGVRQFNFGGSNTANVNFGFRPVFEYKEV